jgi:hypothetical protein
VVSSTDKAGNDVCLAATAGNVLVAYVAAGRNHGQVFISSSGGIMDGDAKGSDDLDLVANTAILCAGGAIGGGPTDPMETNVGTLYKFASGAAINLNITGDIEIFYVGNQAVRVTATGNITATYIKTGGQDVSLTSTGGKIYIDHIDTGTTGGLVNLSTTSAAGSIVMDNTTLTGDGPSINCGNTLTMSTVNTTVSNATTYDIELHGTITTNGTNGLAQFLGNGNVLMAATVTSSNDIKVHSNNGGVTMTGSYAATGAEIEVIAKNDISINGSLTAHTTLDVQSNAGTITMNGTYACIGYADITAYKKLYFNGTLTAGTLVNGKLTSGGGAHMKSQNGIVEAHGTIWAYVEITIDGKPGYIIDAKITSVTKTVSITTH